jgi:hypothetical protein
MPSPITLHRHRTPRGELLTLVAPGYSVTVEVRVRGLELDATTVERALHAAVREVAGR